MSNSLALDESRFTFYPLGPAEELPTGERMFIEVDDQPIVVINIAGLYFAIGDVCTHDNGPLGDGEVDGYQIICPRHGARFDVRTGKAMTLPAFVDTPSYPVRVVEGTLEIGIPK